MSRFKTPTILDVAREAGVSKSAVSRALLGQDDVSSETAKKVRAAADRLGYVPNAMAQGLVSQRTRTLGVVLRDTTTQFYGFLQAAMQRRAAEHGYNIVSVTGLDALTAETARDALRSLIALRVDGLLVSSAQLPGEELVPYIDRVPIVVAGRAEHAAGVVSVHCDEDDGGAQLARHLVGLGHRKVAVLLVPEQDSLGQAMRGQAMIQTLESASVEVTTLHMDVFREPVGKYVSQVLSDPAITAVMCPSDITMVNVLEELRLRNVQVPERLSITGYDGFGNLAESLFGFTSFRLPVEEIGATAVDRVIELIETGIPKHQRTAIQGQLIPGRTASSPS